MSDDRLAQWQADEAAVRARRTRPAGAIAPAETLGRSGLDVLHDMLDGHLPAAPMAEALDFLLVHVGHGEAAFQGRPGPRFLNPMGGLHGGWYATLLDSAVGCAVHTTMPPGRAYTTLELKIEPGARDRARRAAGARRRPHDPRRPPGRPPPKAAWSAPTASSTPTPPPPA